MMSSCIGCSQGEVLASPEAGNAITCNLSNADTRESLLTLGGFVSPRPHLHSYWLSSSGRFTLSIGGTWRKTLHVLWLQPNADIFAEQNPDTRVAICPRHIPHGGSARSE